MGITRQFLDNGFTLPHCIFTYFKTFFIQLILFTEQRDNKVRSVIAQTPNLLQLPPEQSQKGV